MKNKRIGDTITVKLSSIRLMCLKEGDKGKITEIVKNSPKSYKNLSFKVVRSDGISEYLCENQIT